MDLFRFPGNNNAACLADRILTVEQLLIKMARQLDALDEASLVALWNKYFPLAARFEPSRRWEESILILSLIQAKRWKNLLFNQQWAAHSRPEGEAPHVSFSLEHEGTGTTPRKRAKILQFHKMKNDKDPSDSRGS